MQPFTSLEAIGIPYFHHNVDTNQLCPTRFNKVVRGPAYAKILFHDHRFEPDGAAKDFILNTSPYDKGQVLVSGKNFGCGSSRESAVYALAEFGIRAIIAESFGSIFYSNCLKNGLLPIALDLGICAVIAEELTAYPGTTIGIDLAEQHVRFKGEQCAFDIHPLRKRCLMEGITDINLTLQYLDRIVAFEEAYESQFAWTR